jgi:hypothetical protein
MEMRLKGMPRRSAKTHFPLPWRRSLDALAPANFAQNIKVVFRRLDSGFRSATDFGGVSPPFWPDCPTQNTDLKPINAKTSGHQASFRGCFRT